MEVGRSNRQHVSVQKWLKGQSRIGKGVEGTPPKAEGLPTPHPGIRKTPRRKKSTRGGSLGERRGGYREGNETRSKQGEGEVRKEEGARGGR